MIPTPSPVERINVDIDRIHELAETLLPVYADIEIGRELEDESLNGYLKELTATLHELHPADTAAILEFLPLQENTENMCLSKNPPNPLPW